MKGFGSLIPALVTLYDQRGEVDPVACGKLAKTLIEEGCDAILAGGTTGESPNLSHDEKLRLFDGVRNAVGERHFVWAGTGSNNTRETVRLTQEAERLGVDGIMLVTPYYNRPTQEGLYQHFGTVAAATSLPIMLYNVPGRTSCNLLPQTVARLAKDFPNICSIKEAAGSCDQVSELRGLVPESFILFSGDDSFTLPMMALGAIGVVSVAAHVAARPMRQMIDAFLAGKIAEAELIHRRLFPVFRGMFLTSNPSPVKAALELRGIASGGVRLPLTGLQESEVAVLRNILQNAGLI